MKTPIAFLLTRRDGSVAPLAELLTTLPRLQQRRLSWRDGDPVFASFLGFLETDGVDSDLPADDWQARFAAHLDYAPNRHLLYLLWRSLRERESDMEIAAFEQWLPPAYAAAFARQRSGELTDEAIFEALERVCTPADGPVFLQYRGVPLGQAFMYRSLQQLVMQTRAQLNQPLTQEAP